MLNIQPSFSFGRIISTVQALRRKLREIELVSKNLTAVVGHHITALTAALTPRLDYTDQELVVQRDAGVGGRQVGARRLCHGEEVAVSVLGHKR